MEIYIVINERIVENGLFQINMQIENTTIEAHMSYKSILNTVTAGVKLIVSEEIDNIFQKLGTQTEQTRYQVLKKEQKIIIKQ